MKIAIIGAGAIGTLLAGYLADKDEEVVLVAHPEQYTAILQNGLTIEGVRGKLTVKLPVRSKLDVQVDLVILATKTQDLEKAISEQIAYLRGVRILTVQNGVRSEELISQRLGQDKLFSSIAMFGATYLAAGKVIHNFEGDWILGKFGQATKEPIEEIRAVTAKIFPSSVSEDILAMKWLKLFLNANNCLAAILGKSMQATFSNLSICKISLHIWQEAWRLVNQAQIKLVSLPGFQLEQIPHLLSLPLEQSAEIFSKIMTNLSKEPLDGSILQSIRRNRPSEIDYINGEFVKLASSIGQDAPLNKKLVQLVHRIEKTGQFFSEGKLLKQTKRFLN